MDYNFISDRILCSGCLVRRFNERQNRFIVKIQSVDPDKWYVSVSLHVHMCTSVMLNCLKNGLRSWLGTSTEEKTVRQADNSIQDSAWLGGNGHW